MTDESVSLQAFKQASTEVIAALSMLRAGLNPPVTPELHAMWQQVSSRPISVESLKLLHTHYYRWYYEKMGGKGEPIDFSLERYKDDYRATASYFNPSRPKAAPQQPPPGLPHQKSNNGVALVVVIALAVLFTAIAVVAR